MRLATVLTPMLAISLAGSSAESQHARVGRLAELTFETGSAKLGITEEFAPKLGEVVGWAKENPDGLIVLDGHTDAVGGSPYNVQLSLRRAKAVQRELIAIGIDPAMIVIAAYGEESPSGKGNDRRVVVWGTRAGLDAVVARTMRGGHAVIWSGVKTPSDRAPRPGVVVTRR